MQSLHILQVDRYYVLLGRYTINWTVRCPQTMDGFTSAAIIRATGIFFVRMHIWCSQRQLAELLNIGFYSSLPHYERWATLPLVYIKDNEELYLKQASVTSWLSAVHFSEAWLNCSKTWAQATEFFFSRIGKSMDWSCCSIMLTLASTSSMACTWLQQRKSEALLIELGLSPMIQADESHTSKALVFVLIRLAC